MFEKRRRAIIEDDVIEKIKQHEIPQYLLDVYNWAYINPKNVDRLDSPLVFHTLLFGQGGKLIDTYLGEIKKGDRVMQVSHVYGNLIRHLAEKVGQRGSLDVIDVVPYQVQKAKRKLIDYLHAEAWVQDAIMPFHRDYDVIGIFFLLHEVPDHIKKHIIENALNKIDDCDAKIVFVDYHHPSFFHPVRPILNLVNIFLEPYANALWEREISDFTPRAHEYNWEKTTFFGGVYQKVVVTKRRR
jgi:hypothetical protein